MLLLTPLLLLGLAACKKDAAVDPATLPDGATLVKDSAAAMQNVQSTHIIMEIDGTVGTLPIKKAEGDLKRGGDAKGSIQLVQGGQLLEVQFVIIGKDAWLKYPTGGWALTPGITAFYDPSAILDDKRGVANLLTTATDAKTEADEAVGGVAAYRVAVSLDTKATGQLVPGVPGGLTGKVWIDKQTKHLLKAVINVPATTNAAAATVTFTLSQFDAPVTVSAP